MAEKIGFISFSAFDLQKANEFDSIKRAALDTANPTRSFFEHHPPIPEWKNLAHAGIEPITRRTPNELIPLMNEYHRYFLENAVQNEAYLRWVRRHRAWDRETEVVFGRYTELKDHLNERFASEDYRRRGRLHQIMDQATQRAWMHTENFRVDSANDAAERKAMNAKALQKKLMEQAFYQQTAFNGPGEREAWLRRDEATKLAPTTNENRMPLNVNSEQSWSQGLAIAHYQQQILTAPVAPPPVTTSTGTATQTAQAVPIVAKVKGLG